MNITNQMALKFKARSSNEAFARGAAAAFVAQLDPTIDELNDIKTAVSEAVTNSIVHGYRENGGDIVMEIKIEDGQIVHILIKDRGCGIENIKQAREPLFTTGDSDRSGMGFTIMESFMDKLSVSSKPNTGTTVKMSRKIRAKYPLRGKNGQ